jgi:hypothetical protein
LLCQRDCGPVQCRGWRCCGSKTLFVPPPTRRSPLGPGGLRLARGLLTAAFGGSCRPCTGSTGSVRPALCRAVVVAAELVAVVGLLRVGAPRLVCARSARNFAYATSATRSPVSAARSEGSSGVAPPPRCLPLLFRELVRGGVGGRGRLDMMLLVGVPLLAAESRDLLGALKGELRVHSAPQCRRAAFPNADLTQQQKRDTELSPETPDPPATSWLWIGRTIGWLINFAKFCLFKSDAFQNLTRGVFRARGSRGRTAPETPRHEDPASHGHLRTSGRASCFP